tara:strand:- start:14116 stop:14916 length:801 start_codon:yes stop_codon:yes gene_type:complete
MVTLQLHQLGATIGKRTILADISAGPFQGGDVIAVIGPNAAGKSTLFKRIAGLTAGAGTVEHTIKNETGSQTATPPASSICYMPQNLAANAVLSVYEAVLLARKQGASWRVSDDDIAIVDATLVALGILELSERNIGALSGGQQQLVGISQALVREPDILLMDEPTSALDLSRSLDVLEFVRDLAKQQGMIIFIAIHDLNHVLRYADKTMIIANGRLVASGDSHDVITNDMLADVYGVRARLEECRLGIRHVMVDGTLKSRIGFQK